MKWNVYWKIQTFLLFLNDHGVLIFLKELYDRLKIAKSVNFPVNKSRSASLHFNKTTR